MFVILFAIFGCVSSQFPPTYSDEFSRFLGRLNGAVFASDPTFCIKKLTDPSEEWTLVGKEVDVCNDRPNNNCAFFIMKSDVKKQFVVVIRGSVGGKQSKLF
jgi:hypothetical protein